jgi:DNA-binding MarR family transcriptional regulator
MVTRVPAARPPSRDGASRPEPPPIHTTDEEVDPETPWLSDAEQRVWRAFLQLTGGLEDRLDRDLQRDAGMPHAYYLILAMLSEAPNRSLRMSQLAAAAWASPSRISHAVDRLERQGWVTRRPDDRDRRGQIATLTDVGFEHLRQAAPGHAKTVRGILFDPLSAELLSAFDQICRRALEQLHQEGTTTPPGCAS